jgi:predicted metal-dependent hydrolase
MQEAKIATDRVASEVRSGAAILAREAILRGRLVRFRERDRTAAELRETIARIARELGRDGTQDSGNFETILEILQKNVDEDIARLTLRQTQRNRALSSLERLISINAHRREVNKRTKVWKKLDRR